MTDKEIIFYFELHEDFPHQNRKEFTPYYENDKEYYAFCIEPFSLKFEKNIDYGTQTYLFIDGSSVLSSDGSEKGKRFSTPFSNLKFKSNPYKKRILAGNGFFAKNANQIKELVKQSSPPATSINFKVVKSIKSGLDKETLLPNFTDVEAGVPYSYVLEIEPLDLGIEGLPPITKITFFLSTHQDPITGKRSMTNFRKEYEKLVSEATGKELTIEIKQ